MANPSERQAEACRRRWPDIAHTCRRSRKIKGSLLEILGCSEVPLALGLEDEVADFADGAAAA